jgi:hypothetical protein
MSNTRKPALIVMLALIAVLSVGGAALAAEIGRNGKAVTAVRTATNDAAVVIFPEQGMVDVPTMKTTVFVPAGEKAILVITFSADTDCKTASTSSFNQCNVRVLLNGNLVSPGQVMWARSEPIGIPSGGVRSMQWVAGPVNSGTHAIVVQAQSSGQGSFRLAPMTLTVLRSKF